MFEAQNKQAQSPLSQLCVQYTKIFSDVPTLSMFLSQATEDAVRADSREILESMVALMLSVKLYAKDFAKKGVCKKKFKPFLFLYQEVLEPPKTFALDIPSRLAQRVYTALIYGIHFSVDGKEEKSLGPRLSRIRIEKRREAQKFSLLILAILDAYIFIEEEFEDDENASGVRFNRWEELIHPKALDYVNRMANS